MPARRRFPGSESDDNFSVLVDGGNLVTSEINTTELIENPYSGDEKKKYATSNKFIGSGGYSVAGISVPSGLTQWTSSIGNFLQQQVVQVNNATNFEQLFFEQPSEQAKQQQTAPLSAANNNYNDFDDGDDANSACEIVIMASRDRTGEFFNTIRSMQGRNISRAVNIRDPRKATQLQTYSEFMMIAKHIGKNIASTYSKLEKLTLCKWIFILFKVTNSTIINSFYLHFCLQWLNENLSLMIDQLKYKN